MALIPSKATYFLAPNCDFPPNGLIALGSIIVDPKTPHKSLNYRKDQRVPVPVDDLQESFTDKWEYAVTSAGENKATVWTSFLQILLGFGADIGLTLKKGREEVYKFHRLETKFFEPDLEYMKSSLKAEGVRAYASATQYKKPVYMVTGVKIARGASVSSKTLNGYEAMLKVGFDATALAGVPVSGGPKIQSSNANERDAKFEHGSDYIFAYRVVRITFNKDGGLKGQEDYVKGAMFGMDDGMGRNEAAIALEMEYLTTASKELQDNVVVFEVYEDGQIINVAYEKH